MNATAELELYNYLRTLRDNLRDIPDAEREEIVREINAHVRERAQEPDNSISQALRRLGSTDDLASEYLREALIRRASRSVSPLLILKAAWQLATRGILGLCVFLTALFGYALGGGFMITAILKPIFPRETGLWIGPGVFDFGIHEPARYADPVHEVLGWGYIPVALALGCLFVWLTTVAVRKLLRWRRPASVSMHREERQEPHAMQPIPRRG